jgi:hypothetical protein
MASILCKLSGLDGLKSLLMTRPTQSTAKTRRKQEIETRERKVPCDS